MVAEPVRWKSSIYEEVLWRRVLRLWRNLLMPNCSRTGKPLSFDGTDAEYQDFRCSFRIHMSLVSTVSQPLMDKCDIDRNPISWQPWKRLEMHTWNAAYRCTTRWPWWRKAVSELLSDLLRNPTEQRHGVWYTTDTFCVGVVPPLLFFLGWWFVCVSSFFPSSSRTCLFMFHLVFLLLLLLNNCFSFCWNVTGPVGCTFRPFGPFWDQFKSNSKVKN